MSDPRSPSEIAREALIHLAARHLPPTPANFQSCYNEIAGLPEAAPFPETQLRQLADALVPHGDVQKEALHRVATGIQGRSWMAVQEGLLAFVAGRDRLAVDSLPEGFSRALVRLLETVLPAFGEDDPRLAQAAQATLAELRRPGCEVLLVEQSLRRLAHQAAFAVEESIEVRQSLLHLLHLIIENIGELSLDDSWLKGQIDGLLAAVEPPLTLRHLDEMERRLRDVMDKQSRAKARSVEAQEEMRLMLSAFIDRLASMNASSASFEQNIESSAKRIEAVSRIEDVAPLLKEIVVATHAMAEETSHSREQLRDLQDKVRATEAELVQLHLELDNASALARHDPLTDALNRKGLDEALIREIAAVRRRDVPLSVCLLDIDNFKKLNDRLGHAVGDDALVHLANVARRCMRPTDTLARYGGEEFVILMPDTSLEPGIEVMTRLQRELTKAFFMAGKEKLLITFSAGVAQLLADEDGHGAIRRADEAMYLAKRAGKNRVFGA
ncbi:diguanylate cyclase [Azonexus sp. R2A61]|uniref:GGDEF domain-containing protein n=1 Tax=Azonexus sp. R2A61 TaxID=2744443 RepID=UPI001F217C42|nr:GGDEF domain-containing protein [Azonexus sp. R2A61]